MRGRRWAGGPSVARRRMASRRCHAWRVHPPPEVDEAPDAVVVERRKDLEDSTRARLAQLDDGFEHLEVQVGRAPGEGWCRDLREVRLRLRLRGAREARWKDRPDPVARLAAVVREVGAGLLTGAGELGEEVLERVGVRPVVSPDDAGAPMPAPAAAAVSASVVAPVAAPVAAAPVAPAAAPSFFATVIASAAPGSAVYASLSHRLLRGPHSPPSLVTPRSLHRLIHRLLLCGAGAVW